MTDFFISYTSAQTQWAEWIGYVLEEEGFTVIIQAWDFRPGSNFVLEMQKAASTADRTLLVLSPDYMNSQFAAPEWAAAFANDPQGLNQTLVPVVVEDCQPPGLLKSIVHIKLMGMDEAAARQLLLAGIDKKRAKPSNRPAFPGKPAARPHKAFPGTVAAPIQAVSPAAAYMPNLKRVPSDVDKRRFLKDSFTTIKSVFEQGLAQLAQQESGIEFEFTPNTATEFRAEIFLNGSAKCKCRIWQGALHSSDSIGFAEGHTSMDGACNEILSLSDEREGLSLKALMATGYGEFERSVDMNRLSKDQAAEYLWRRFIMPLER